MKTVFKTLGLLLYTCLIISCEQDEVSDIEELSFKIIETNSETLIDYNTIDIINEIIIDSEYDVLIVPISVYNIQEDEMNFYIERTVNNKKRRNYFISCLD